MSNYPLVRSALGALFLLDLLSFTPSLGTFFGREYHAGSPLAGKAGRAVTWALWCAGALGLITGRHTLAAAAALLVCFRWWYVDSRWRGLFLGAGAVGMVSWVAVTYLALVELSLALDPAGQLTAQVGRVLRIDFAAILLCSGAYKALTGYLLGEGAELGLVNPAWGRFHARLRRVSPDSRLWPFLSALGVLGELGAGLLLLLFPASSGGPLLCIAMFAFILTFLRLGRLAPMMMALALLFAPELGVLPGLPPPSAVGPPPPLAGAALWLSGALTAYVAILVAVKVTQYLGLFAGFAWPRPLHFALLALSAVIPIHVWRLFDGDFTNFFVRAYRVGPDGERPLIHEDTTYSRAGWRTPRLTWRFRQAGESVVLAAIFTRLKLPGGSRALFQQQLLAFARTLPGERLRFEYVAIEKRAGAFELNPLSSFQVDVAAGTVQERPLGGSIGEHLRCRYGPAPASGGRSLHWWLARRAGKLQPAGPPP